MKDIITSNGMTNFLIATLIAIVAYTFVTHVNEPWHGDIGVRMSAVEKDIEYLRSHIGPNGY